MIGIPWGRVVRRAARVGLSRPRLRAAVGERSGRWRGGTGAAAGVVAGEVNGMGTAGETCETALAVALVVGSC